MLPRLHQHWTLGARGVFQIERVLIFRPSTVYHIINKPTSLSFGRLAPACNLFLSKMNHWDGSRCVGQVLVKPHWVTRCDFFFRYADYAEITRFISQIAVFIGQFPSIALVKFFSSLFCVLFSRLGFFWFIQPPLHAWQKKYWVTNLVWSRGIWICFFFAYRNQGMTGHHWASLGILQAEDGLSDAPGSPRNYGVAW
jgi:hypothetical protein